MNSLIRSLTFAVLAVSLFLFSSAASAQSCGHWYWQSSNTPAVEAGGPVTTITAGTGYQTVLQSCADELQTPSNAAFTAIMRAMVFSESATASVGSTYDIEFSTVKGGVYTVQQEVSRTIRHTINADQPQTDYVAAMLTGLTGGNGYRIRIRLNGSGTITLNVFANAQGSLAGYGGTRGSTNTSSITLSTSWQEIGSVTFNNTTADNVDLQLQGHFTINSGSTAGAKISVGLGLEYGSSGNHYSSVYVPPATPDSVTVMDHMPNEGVGDTLISPGSHTIRMWAKINSGTVSISNRRVEVLPMGASPAGDSIRLYPFNDTVKTHEQNSGPQPQACILLDVSQSFTACNTTATQPQAYPNAGCGNWTKLLEATVPVNANTISEYGEAYVEILDKTCDATHPNCWSGAPSRIQVALEGVTGGSQPAATDLILTTASVPDTTGHLYIPTDGFSWGNSAGNTVRLWIRFDNCNSPYVAGRQLKIGRVYFGQKWYSNNGTLHIPN